MFLPGGMLIPLELLPRPLELISFALPFATMAYVPGRIASGHPDPLLLVWQLGWLAALLAMAGSRVRGRRAAAAGDGRMTAVAATLRTAVADGLANRNSFWFQVSLMVANDITWIIFWVLFFNEVGNLRGWDAHDVIVLFSILLTTAGVALGLFANSRKIGQLAADGALDETLTLPVPPLAHLLSTPRRRGQHRRPAAGPGGVPGGRTTPARSGRRCSCSGWSRARWC